MTSPERQKRPAAPRKPVEREKSLSLDDVFAQSFLKDATAGNNRQRTPKESRSLCGDRTTKKTAKSRGGDYDGADESGNETDTGHSVATTGHRSQRRIPKINRGTPTTSSPPKRSRAADAAQVLTGLYSSPNHGDDTESEESDGRNAEIYPVKRSQSSKAKSSRSQRPESTKDRNCRRTVSDTPPSSAESSAETGAPRVAPGTTVKPGSVRSNRERPENARAQSSINLSTGKPDRVRIREDGNDGGAGSRRLPSSASKSRRETERSERHLGDRPKPKSERHLKERLKSERHLKDTEQSERRLRERSKSRTRPQSSAKSGESTPRASRSTLSREGSARHTSTPSSEHRSRSRRRIDDNKEGLPISTNEKPTGKAKTSRMQPPHPPSPSKSRTPSRAREKPSSNKQSAVATSKKSSIDVRGMGTTLKQPQSDSRMSPKASDRRKTESTGATATATEDALSSSDESSNGVDAHGSSTVLQFDPTQQGDNGVYRVQQVTSAASASGAVEGGIAELVDPLGTAQQLDQPSGHPKDNPIFQFLDSDDFDFFPSSSVAPLDRPSGDEASEDDDLVNSPGNNDSLLSFGGRTDLVPAVPVEPFVKGLTEKLGRDENAFGYSGDGTFVDDNNPYGYNVDETFESQHGSYSQPAAHGPSHDSCDEKAYLYDDDDVGRGSFSNPYGLGTGESMLPARDAFGDDGSQLDETDSTSHYDQQSTLHDSFMPQPGAPQFNPSTFGCAEPFFINSEAADEAASFEDAWGASQAETKTSALEFDQSFDHSFNFDDLKRPASTDGSHSNLHQSHESKDLEGPRLGDGTKKKRVVKVKVVKKSASGPPSEEQGPHANGNPAKRKVVRRKVKSAPQNDGTEGAAGNSAKEKEPGPSVSEPINERKKALHQMKAPKTPTTPSKLFVSKLYGSLSRFNNSGNLHSDDGSLPDEAPTGTSTKPVSYSPGTNLQGSASPGVSASGKRAAFATSIGRYFSRNVRNPSVSGSVGNNGADEGSISTSNSRGSSSRGSLGLFVGKKSSRAKHHLLGDDSSYDSGNLVKRS